MRNAVKCLIENVYYQLCSQSGLRYLSISVHFPVSGWLLRNVKFCLLTCNIISVTIQAVIKSPSHVPMAATFMNVWFSIPIRLLACILSMYLPSKKNHVSSGICIVNKGLGSLHIISPLLLVHFSLAVMQSIGTIALVKCWKVAQKLPKIQKDAKWLLLLMFLFHISSFTAGESILKLA